MNDNNNIECIELTGGLSTKQALVQLKDDIDEYLAELEPQLLDMQSWRYILRQAYHHKSVGSTFRWTSIVFLTISTITYIFSIIYGHFNSVLPLIIQSIILALVLVLNTSLAYWNARSRFLEIFHKARHVSHSLGEHAANESLLARWQSSALYPPLNTPTSPCISLQWTYRDGKLVNLPSSLLVAGDVVLVCPGRHAPATCRRIDRVLLKKPTLSDFEMEMQFDGPNVKDSMKRDRSEYDYIFYGEDSSRSCSLAKGEVFVPTSSENVADSFTIPRLRNTAKPSKFMVIETPYIKELKVALTNHALHRTPTAFQKELRLTYVRYLEHILVPFTCLLVFVFSVVHYCYVEFARSSPDATTAAAIVLIFLRPIMSIIPLLPLALPMLWLVLNSYGLIKLYVMYEAFALNGNNIKSDSDSYRLVWNSPALKSGNGSFPEFGEDCELLQSPSSLQQDRVFKNLYLDDIDIDSLKTDKLTHKRDTLVDMFRELWRFAFDKSQALWRTANLLHVLGSITALCCVDRHGIISWPSPTADKVFFLTPPSQTTRKNSNQVDNLDDEMSEIEQKQDNEDKGEVEVTPERNDHLQAEHHHHRHQQHRHSSSVMSSSATGAAGGLGKTECVQLDITPDRHNPYGLQFDDIYWDRYLSSLKPLGLAILLNNCNSQTQEDFIKFGDHITCESMHNEVVVPVMNKRCLCELARQIGFKENAVKGYEYLYPVSLFRHIRPEVIQKGKLAKSLNFPRLKMPFPNMMCAVIKDTFANSSQLFSQGTGDLVLDACAEYWNGQSLVLLTDYERKKILDFYQRSSLTSYCCAFAYLPLINDDDHGTIRNFLQDCYIELPPDSSHLFPSQRSLDANLRGLALDSHAHHHNVSPNIELSTSIQSDSLYLDATSKSLGHHLSSDTIVKLSQMAKEEQDKARGEDETGQSKHKDYVTDNQKVEKIMKKVVNEVFIGMTTLQYQACSDFVRLIELLEAACIRFVHFSKENELRSRVFSEKMGLESGWNCHISLLNDDENINEEYDHDKVELEDSIKSKGNIEVENMDSNNLQVKYTRPRRHSSSSLSSIDSVPLEPGIMVNNSRGHRNFKEDNQSAGDDLQACNNENGSRVRCGQRRKRNSFSVSSRSERSGSIISSTAKKLRDFRKLSSHQERNLSPSPSRLTTTSSVTDHSAPIGFDMRNRAKLPKGIDNIRPHLENVDNVPLLVSLFTDCTPEATREMIKIMQENEEVVCVIGSVANDANVPIFLQADASIGIEPMYPHACLSEPLSATEEVLDCPKEAAKVTSPTELANQLVSLPCSLTMPRQNSIVFYQLIMTARDYMLRMRNIFQFYLSSCLSLSLAQLITSLLFLPPLLSPGIVIWLSLIVMPVLSISLMGNQTDPGVMNIATGKKLHFNKETISYFFIGFLIKFTPSMVISVILFAIIIGTSCSNQSNVGRHTIGPCWMFSDVRADGDVKTDIIWASHLLIGQTIASLFLVLYLILISINFVHPHHLLWQKNPMSNLCWFVTSIVLLVSHLLVCYIEILFNVPVAEIFKHLLEIIPFYTWIIGFAWPFVLLATNIITKRHEINMHSRQQRRARLEFGTKLGMNSPF